MFTKNDFIKKYEEYSDDQLFEVYTELDNYSNEAKEAFHIVIKKHGGVDGLLKKQAERKIVADEIDRINAEVTRLDIPGEDTDFLKKMITSSILSPGQLEEVVNKKFDDLKKQNEDKKVKPQTIFGSVLGGIIASMTGGVLWGLQMIYSNRIFIILLFGLAIYCYFIIWLATRQSAKNRVVLLTTILSFFVSIILGTFLFQIIGYQG